MTEDNDFDGSELNDLQALSVDGSELSYRISGSGPPVLLIHGIFGVLEVWGGVQDALATTHRVISYDRRGHGRSPNGTSDMRVHARDASELLERLAGQPAIVGAWSGGVAVAMELIRSHTELVSAAVLIEPPFHLARHQPLPSLRMLSRVKLDLLRGRKRDAAKSMALFAFARRNGGNGWHELDNRQREWFLGDADGLITEFRVLERYNTSADHISKKEIAEWSVPMTYLLGEDSAPWAHLVHDVLIRAAPQIRTVKVPNACHLIPLQQPRSVSDAVRSAIPS